MLLLLLLLSGNAIWGIPLFENPAGNPHVVKTIKFHLGLLGEGRRTIEIQAFDLWPQQPWPLPSFDPCLLSRGRHECTYQVSFQSAQDPPKRNIWPLTTLTFPKLNPSRAILGSTYIHPPSLAKIAPRTSEEKWNKQTNKQTNVAQIIVWYSHWKELVSITSCSVHKDL